MDISRRIRAVLAGVDFASGGEHRIPALMVRRLRGETFSLPERICDFVPHLPAEQQGNYYTFCLSGIARILSAAEKDRKTGRVVREAMDRYEAFGREGIRGEFSVVDALWVHWVLVLGMTRFGREVDREFLAALWTRGFSEQDEAGHLHQLTSETLLDGFVYDELVAIHAAYNSARLIGDEAMIQRVQRAVRWHVENTQPDNTTNEPWGLAAFAELDETGTFAEQQLHDAVAWLGNGPGMAGGKVPAAVGLLADAVITLENG